MKKLLASILILAMMVVAIPLSVSAVDADYVTFDAAVEVGRVNSKAVIDLYFSEPVHFVRTDKDIAKLCNKYNTTGSSPDWQHFSHNNDEGIYLNPQTGEDGKLYSQIIRLTFDRNGSTGKVENIIPNGAAGVRLMENYTNTAAYDGVLDVASIVGISGRPIKATHTVDSKNETAWVDLTRGRITLQDVQFDGWIATLTFSAPVNFAGLANAIRACNDYLGANPQYQPDTITYLGDVTVKDGASYSRTVRISFKNASSPNYIDGDKYGYAPQIDGYGIRLMEFTGGDGAANGEISTKNIIGLTGLPVAGTHTSEAADITFMAASAVRSLTQFVKAEVTDPSSGWVTLTFSAPVNLDDVAAGFRMTWDYNPDDKAEGHYQFQPDANTDIVYLDGEEYNGKTYGTTVAMKFALGKYDSIPVNAGIRIIEYNKTADLGNCSVSPTVATDKNGLPLAANKRAGRVDIAWQELTFSGATTALLGAQMVDDAVVLVDFSRPVTLNDVSGITVAGKAAVSAESVSGAEFDGQWKISFADALDTADKAMIEFAASAMKDVYGCDLVTPAQALLDPWQDENIDHGEDFSDDMDTKLPYHFMNTDTGRALAVGAVDEWYLEKIDGVNMYVLTDGEGQYLDLTGATPVLSDYPCKVMLVKGANERYQLVVGGKMVLADSDEGETAAIELERQDVTSRDIASGWYLTKKGEVRPLRVMPLGDSITYGVNLDLAASELRVGYRAQLSQALTEYLGRVVFVGSEVTATTTLDETRLLRHAGFPGYVVTDIWGEEGHPGVDELIDGLCDKYAPDAVLLMLGTNDLSRMVNAGTTEDSDLADQITRYIAFLEKIAAGLDERGTIICSSLTPRAEGTNVALKQEMVSKYNVLLEAMVEELAAEGMPIVFNDNFAAVDALGDAGLCSDKIHLSVAGSQALGEQYLATFKSVYDEQGEKKLAADLQALLDNASEGDTVVLTQDYDARDVERIEIPAGVTLDLNGHTVYANNLASFGDVIDSGDGTAVLVIAKSDDGEHIILKKDNTQLPLYDSQAGGYRFFTYSTEALKRADEDTNVVKYGMRLKFTNQSAYLLLADADVALTMDLEIGDYRFTYTFKASTLATYAEWLQREPESVDTLVIVLTVTGLDNLDAATPITATPVWVSGTKVEAKATAMSHTTA